MLALRALGVIAGTGPAGLVGAHGRGELALRLVQYPGPREIGLGVDGGDGGDDRQRAQRQHVDRMSHGYLL